MLLRVEDLRTSERTSGARGLPSHSEVLAVRYREAVWAWYAAKRVGSGSRAAARLEERLHQFEEAAASVELADRWYFLESARLIRAGVLTGARSAFDAGVSASKASTATLSRALEVPLTVDIGVLPPAVDVAVVPPIVESAPRQGLFRRIASRWLPGRRS
jgi:hypothetical protein